MTKLYAALLAVTAAIAVGACSQGEDQAATEVQVSNELLAYAPSDTPYLFANLQPMPDEVVDYFFTHAQPALEETQSQLSHALADMESAPPDIEDSDVMARLHLAVLQEFDGKLSRTGLQSLGIDPRSHYLIYGVGAFPVIRLGLSDAQALRATVQRILDRSGISAPELDYQGVSYWRIGDTESAEDQVGLYLSILPDHLAIGLLPSAEEEQQLPLFLGVEMPADSDAKERLVKLNKEGNYTPYGSGILDFHRLADQFLQADSSLAGLLSEHGDYDPASMTPQCVSEIHSIIDNGPVLTMGTVEMSTQALAIRYELDTPATLAGQLLGLVSEIPAAAELSNRVLEFSFGMRFGPVRDFLREKTTAIVDDPYQCEHLAELNQHAADSLVQLNQPMPPFLNNFLGVRASLDEITMGGNSIPQNARGHLAVHVDKPEMFVGMAQMMLPDLTEMNLVPNDPPVRVPETLIPVPGMVAFAALSDEAIGMSVGEGEQDSLPAFLDAEAGPEGMFLSVDYDMPAYLEFTQSMSGMTQDHHDDDTGEMTHGDHSMIRIADTMKEAYKQMMDRSRTTFRFTADGIEVETRMTFK